MGGVALGMDSGHSPLRSRCPTVLYLLELCACLASSWLVTGDQQTLKSGLCSILLLAVTASERLWRCGYADCQTQRLMVHAHPPPKGLIVLFMFLFVSVMYCLNLNCLLLLQYSSRWRYCFCNSREQLSKEKVPVIHQHVSGALLNVSIDCRLFKCCV